MNSIKISQRDLLEAVVDNLDETAEMIDELKELIAYWCGDENAKVVPFEETGDAFPIEIIGIKSSYSKLIAYVLDALNQTLLEMTGNMGRSYSE